MTGCWFIYYTLRFIKGKDSEGDALLCLIALLLDCIWIPFVY